MRRLLMSRLIRIFTVCLVNYSNIWSMKQVRSLSKLSCLSEYTKLYPSSEMLNFETKTYKIQTLIYFQRCLFLQVILRWKFTRFLDVPRISVIPWTSWLSFVISIGDVVTFTLVSWVRCGAWLYRFPIFALILTYNVFLRFTSMLVQRC